MKPQQPTLPSCKKNETKTILITGIVILILQLAFHLTVGAKSFSRFNASSKDSIQMELAKQLNTPAFIKRLNFPNTVKRFYTHNKLEANWLRPEQDITPTVSAMLLLDCVKQYGLQHKNYHPDILNYTMMYDALSQEKRISVTQKVEFELMLTDAMVSMINHLHFGRFNPNLSTTAIDNGVPSTLKADELLWRASKSSNLTDSIIKVQPKQREYRQLQDYMKLIAGQYTCDSYETPESEIRAMAINMERLRWLGLKSDVYVQVNIPSFQLFYFNPDSMQVFRVVVGKPLTPTPILLSEITSLETAPDWKIPNKIFINELLPKAERNLAFFDNNHMAVYDEKENFVPITSASLSQLKKQPKLYHAKQTTGCDNALGKVVFRFKNAEGIYLHDTPEQQYFNRSKRSLSHGCVRVEHAETLASILLRNDNQLANVAQLQTAMATYKKQQFTLKTPVPILITYLTVTVEDGLLVHHEDIYKLDKVLEDKIYEPSIQLNNVKR